MKSLILYAQLLVSLLGLDEDNALACWESPATWRGSEWYQHVCQISLGSEYDPIVSLAHSWSKTYSITIFTESDREG